MECIQAWGWGWGTLQKEEEKQLQWISCQMVSKLEGNSVAPLKYPKEKTIY